MFAAIGYIIVATALFMIPVNLWIAWTYSEPVSVFYAVLMGLVIAVTVHSLRSGR